MLLNSFVGVIYQGLRKVCATSGPCISTRTWFVLNGSPCLIELTRCGRKTNQPSSIAWRPLCQPTRWGRKTNQPSSIAWRPLCQPTREVDKLASFLPDVNLNIISEEDFIFHLQDNESSFFITYDTASNKVIEVSLEAI